MVDLLLSTFPIYRGYAKFERLQHEFIAKSHSRDGDLRYLATGSLREGYLDPETSDADTMVILNPPEEMFSQDCQMKLFHPVDEAPAHVKLVIPQAYLNKFKQEHHRISAFFDLVENTEEGHCFVSAEKTRRLNRRDFQPDCIDESNKPSAPWTEVQTAEGGSDLCPAYTLHDTHFKSDRVPAIECTGWPCNAREWVSRKPRYWPQEDTIERIAAGGFMVVPKPSNISGDTLKEWRISFSIPESLLFETFDECHAMVYYLLRSLYVRSFKEKLYGSLTSYHLKTVMFWMLEETEPSFWSRERIVDIFMCALKKLLEYTRDGFLPHYFIPSHNLFYKTSKEGLELAKKEIMFVLKQPLDALGQMVTPKFVALMPHLGLLSVDMKTKENMSTRDGFLPHYFIPSHNLFYKTSKESLELVKKEILFVLNHPLDALGQMVALMPHLGLSKPREDMNILHLWKSVVMAYVAFTQGKLHDLVLKIDLKFFSQKMNDRIITLKSSPEDVSLLNLYFSYIKLGYALACAMEFDVSAATFDAEKMNMCKSKDFLKKDTVNIKQSLEMWTELVKIAVDDVIAHGEENKPFLSFMRHFSVFYQESFERLFSGFLTEGDKETLRVFRKVCATAGVFLATVKFSAKDIAYAVLYQLLCEIIPSIPALERTISVEVTAESMGVLCGGSLKMTNCLLKQ